MQSEELRQHALLAVQSRADAFRSAVSLTANQIRGMLAAQRVAAANTAGHASAALGTFATGRINADRFARLLAPARPADTGRTAVFERALAVLEDIEARGEHLFHVRVEAGGDLHAAVENALADAGRVFLAARLAATAGVNDENERELQTGFPFRRWSRAERRLAPPLVIELEGGDLVPAGLASYLDGSACFVFLVSGHAPSAALARLIAPGVLVAQTNAPEELAHLAAFAGPVAVGLMPSECARFVHRPASDGGLGTIDVTQAPSPEPRRPIGSVSVFQQQQDVRWLSALTNRQAPMAEPAVASTPVNAPEPVVAAPTAGSNGHAAAGAPALDPVGTLAAWLLSRVDLSDLEGGG